MHRNEPERLEDSMIIVTAAPIAPPGASHGYDPEVSNIADEANPRTVMERGARGPSPVEPSPGMISPKTPKNLPREITSPDVMTSGPTVECEMKPVGRELRFGSASVPSHDPPFSSSAGSGACGDRQGPHNAV